MRVVKKRSAAVLYDQLKSGTETEQLFQLLCLTKEELLVYGRSELLNRAYVTVRESYGRYLHLELRRLECIRIHLEQTGRHRTMSLFDAYILIFLLADTICSEPKNWMLEHWSRYLGTCAVPKNPVIPELEDQISRIDEGIKRIRSMQVNALGTETGEILDCGKDSSLQEAEEEAGKLRQKAEQEAENIRKNAEMEAERYLEEKRITAEKEAAKLLNETCQKEESRRLEQYWGHWKEAEQNLNREFGEMKTNLEKLSASLLRTEKEVRESRTRKIFEQFFELYLIVSDIRDTADEEDNTYHNMNMLLEIIVEHLADHGILCIHSSNGTKLQGGIHSPANIGGIDPRNAVISHSIRPGFCWGDMVLEKEIVAVMESEECV